MLRLDCVKNSVKVWVLSKIRKTARKLYFWKKFDIWQITLALFEYITLKTKEI